MYSFRTYSEEYKSDWFYVANQELSSCIIAHEEDSLEENKEYNIIIYKNYVSEDKKKVPIAIFVSNGPNFKIKGLIKELDANFGGLHIRKDFLIDSFDIKYFFYKKVVLDYFVKNCNIDFLNVMYPAIDAIEKPQLSFISNPTPYSYMNNNSILYMDLVDDFIQNLKSKPRQEIRKGVRFIEKNVLLNNRDEKTIDYFVYLDKFKANRLGINEFTRDDFKKLLASKFHNVLICLDKDTQLPVGGFIYSLIGHVGDSIYIAGTDVERKTFVNKALTYIAMQECKSLEAKYFVIGHGYDDGNMAAVAKYKRSMSTSEVACGMFRSPLSLKAKIYTSLLLFRRR